jgi:hypothetical protein
MSKTRVQTQSKRSSSGTHRRDFEKVHSSRSEARNVEGVERNGEGRSRQARIDEELERQRPVQSGRNFSKLRGEGPSRPNSRKESEVGYEKSKGNSDGRHEAALYKGGQERRAERERDEHERGVGGRRGEPRRDKIEYEGQGQRSVQASQRTYESQRRDEGQREGQGNKQPAKRPLQRSSVLNTYRAGQFRDGRPR